MARDRGWEVQGVDISEYAVAHCCETLGLRAVAGDLKEARFPDQWFDVVTLWDVIEHFSNPGGQLKEVHRVLKKDGIILMDTPNEDGLLRWIARMVYRASGGKISYPVRKLYHEFHLSYFTTETLQMLLQKNGFALIHLEKKCIPLIKARGRPLERLLVKAISFPERILNREYELLAVAKKVA
jgi:2-polyprenyl-3-methyl-5-hydroxy-6-metoxy-1,4-benzoquinol methylase